MTATADDRHLQAGPTPPPLDAGRPGIALVRRQGDTLNASGQTAVGADGALIATGRVGAEVDLDTARRCAWQCAANVVDAVRAELGSLDTVAQVTRITVYVASTPEFTDQHLVADAATSYFRTVFGDDAGHHARAALGVAVLPTDSPVEVDAIFQIR